MEILFQLLLHLGLRPHLLISICKLILDHRKTRLTSWHSKPPPCITNESELVYVNGVISVIGTFANCLRNIADPMLLPSMRDGQITSQMVVNNTIQFNNLHLVCPLSSLLSLSLSLSLLSWPLTCFAVRSMLWKARPL
jgi:hypothetical protein